MKEYNINGVNVYQHGDSGEPLIFIHAFPLCSAQWDSQVNFFEKDFKVITYDIRGLGHSTFDKSYPVMMEDHVYDLFEIIESLKLDKPIVCGLSIGGYIILRALQKNQTKFSKVILANTRAERDSNEILIARHTIVTQMKKGKKDLFLNQFLKNVISKQSFENDNIKETIKKVMLYQSAEGIAQTANALATRTDNLEFLKDINLPVLIIGSDEDKTTPLSFSETLHNNIRNSILKIINGVGHISNMENPDEFNKFVYEFLKS